MQKEKIKLAVLEAKYYGLVTSVDDLIVRLDKDRFDVTFIYLSGDSKSENHFEKAGYKVHYLSNGKRMNIFRLDVLFRLIRFLQKNRFDLLHCHAHKATQFGSIAGLFSPKSKIIAHVHGLNRSARLRRKISNFLFLGRIDRFLTVAKAVAEDLIGSNFRISASKVTVLDNSVDYDKFANVQASKGQVRKMLNIPQDAFVFGVVGRFSPTKGLSYLIDAFAEVRHRFSHAYLLLLGRGPDEQQCRQQVQKLGLQDSVCFAGFRNDIEQIFHGMDVFVMSSIAEGMPRVLLEAMAAGVPCIGTKVGGIPEVLNDRVGILVESKDSTALAEAMKEMMQKKVGELQSFGTCGNQRVRTLYSHTVVAERLRDIYLEVLGDKERWK